MKKEIVFVYDIKTKKLIEVCDLRDLTSDQYESFSKEAKKNVASILKENEEKKRIKEQKRKEEINALQTQIDDLKMAVSYLLGWDEFDADEVRELVEPEESAEPEPEEETHETEE